MKFKAGLYRVTKNYRGGHGVYNLIVDQSTIDAFGDQDSLLENIGEATNGGHESGWNIRTRRIQKPIKKYQTLSYGTKTVYGLKYH